MNKTVLLVLVFCLMIIPVAQAAESESNNNLELGAKTVSIDQSFSITKFEDGRVAPVSNAALLSENQLDSVLLEMDVSNEEIAKLPLEFKKQIVNRGGIKVELHTNPMHYYHSLDGNKYLVTDANRESINEIRERDLNTLLASGKNISSLDQMGSASDGIWSASSSLFYTGKSSTGAEYIYDYYSSYNWSNTPNFYLFDSIAHAWDYGISSAVSHGANNYRTYQTSSAVQEPMDITRKPGGTKGDFDLRYAYNNWGALHDELRIPVSYKGTTKQLAASYAHPYHGGIVSATLNFFSINWSIFNGDEYHWDSTFTVHN